MKTFNGKAIYNPSGKAGEYSYWACNFYVGCSNGCTYCYLRKGVLAHTMGGNTPTLKKCFKDEEHALRVFEKELKANLPELQRHGLFFSFTTDVMLPETIELTKHAVSRCLTSGVPVKLLSKKIPDEWFTENIFINAHRDLIVFGFTLTGHDEMEPGASPNADRIAAMRKLHDAGFKTWASIEPVIDTWLSINMIGSTLDFCSLYKVGIESGKKYDRADLSDFVNTISSVIRSKKSSSPKIYFKDSLLKQAGIRREDLPVNCVGRDYNMFND